MWMSPALRVISVVLPIYFLQLPPPSDTPVATPHLHKVDWLTSPSHESDIMDPDIQETDRPIRETIYFEDGDPSQMSSKESFVKKGIPITLLRQTVKQIIELEPFITMGVTLAITSGTILWRVHRRRSEMLGVEERSLTSKQCRHARHLGMGDAYANVCSLPAETPLCSDNFKEPERIRRTKRQLDMAIDCPIDIVSITSLPKEADTRREEFNDVSDEHGSLAEDCLNTFYIGNDTVRVPPSDEGGTFEHSVALFDDFPSASCTASLTNATVCSASASSSSTTVMSSTSTSAFFTPLTSPRSDSSSHTLEDGAPGKGSVINLIKSEPKSHDEAMMFLEENLNDNNLSPLHRSILSMRLNNHRLIRENSQRRRLDMSLGLNAILSPLREASRMIIRYDDDII